MAANAAKLDRILHPKPIPYKTPMQRFRRKKFRPFPRNGMNCGIALGGIDGIYSADFQVRLLNISQTLSFMKLNGLRMKKQALVWIGVALAIALFPEGCQISSSQSTDATKVELPSDPHHHPVDVHESSTDLDLCNKDFGMVKTPSPSKPIQREHITANQRRSWKAFTVCVPMPEQSAQCQDKLYVEDIQASQTYEIQTTCFLPWRPFSSFVWLTDDILVFDQWATPHFGHHYAVDMREGRLVLASPFPDQETLDQQQSQK